MTIEDILTELHDVVRGLAASSTRSRPHLFDDAVQEAEIAIWKASVRTPDAGLGYYYRAAKKAIVSVATESRSMTGSPRQGKRPDAHSMSIGLQNEYGHDHDRAVVDEYPSDGIDPREVISGLNDLDGLIVYTRFWLDYGSEDIAELTGRASSTIRKRWMNIRPLLREALAES